MAASFPGCNKPADRPISQAAPEPIPASEPAPAVLTSQPSPPLVPSATPPPATPEPNYLAPDGVFFVTAATSVMTDDGITGLRPGTRAIKQPDGRYLAEGHLIELRPDQITNDLRVAARVTGVDQSVQAKIKQASAVQAQALEAQQRELAQQHAASQQTVATTQVQVGAQRAQEIANVRTKIAAARQTKAHLQATKFYQWQVEFRKQEAIIRSLQQELSRLGVGGAMLE